MIRNMPGGGLNITGATLKVLIQQAYDVRDFQISGGPGWIDSDRYDIAAKAAPGTNLPTPDPRDLAAQRQAMEVQRERMRALLAERFQLKIRRETKQLPVYVLTQAKGGSKLKESNLDAPAPAPNANKGTPRFQGAGIRVTPGHIMGQYASLDFLVQLLSQFVGRTVIDKTGLKGSYDFTLEWTPDTPQGLGPVIGGPGEPVIRPDNPAAAEPSGPSLFTALQEQLRLKLESQKGPVEVIVIESVEKPSEN
jgi:uncharacterized protein (TIGR03435 family)